MDPVDTPLREPLRLQKAPPGTKSTIKLGAIYHMYIYIYTWGLFDLIIIGNNH